MSQSMISIYVFDDGGNVIAAQEVKAYEAGKRFSVWCANSQRKLDTLLAQHPNAATAKIGTSDFEVRHGRSMHVFK